jgi:hypothetical protein
MPMSKYQKLEKVLTDAMEQASRGKGKERHADDEPFENQKICVINRWIAGSPVAGALFQAVKKTVESSRLSGERAINELRGAINYLAAAIILLEEKTPPESEEEGQWGHSILEDIDDQQETINRGNDIARRLYQMIHNKDMDKAEVRLCTMCRSSSIPTNEMPCKKCFYLPIKPHWRPQD